MRQNSATYLYALSTKQASWGSFGWEAAKWIPGVGAIPSFIDAGTELYKGNFGSAALNAVSGVAGLVGGGAVARGLTGAGRMALQAGASAAGKGLAGRAAAGALNAGGKALTQAGAGTAKAVQAAGAANTAVSQGIQKVVPIAKNTTWTGNPVRSLVNAGVRNPFEAARQVLPGGGSGAVDDIAAGATAAAPPSLPPPPPAQGFSAPQPFRPRPMVNF